MSLILQCHFYICVYFHIMTTSYVKFLRMPIYLKPFCVILINYAWYSCLNLAVFYLMFDNVVAFSGLSLTSLTSYSKQGRRVSGTRCRLITSFLVYLIEIIIVVLLNNFGIEIIVPVHTIM